MFNNMWRCSCVAAWLALVLILTSCGGVSPATIDGSSSLSAVTIAVSPQSMAMSTGAQQAFTATVTNTSKTSVSWMVNGIAGGNSTFGTIDKTGNYTAPPYVPIPPNVTVTAVSNADESKTANAAVSISGQTAPGTVTITPKSANLVVGGTALFTASVNDANPAVTWLVNGETGGNSSVGTLTPLPGSGDQALYTAPLQVPDAGAVTVTAVSVANPQQAASAVVNISPATQGGAMVTIVSPVTPPSVPVGETQPFQASVTGVSNTTVSWQVDGIPGGSAAVGTITGGSDDTATYTAPQATQVVQVIAVSNAQPSATASISVNVIPPQNVTVTVSADSCTNTNAVTINSTVQFTAAVAGNNNQTVTWQVNQVDGGNSQVGTISTGGLYTAPANVPNPATVTVSAVSNAVPSVSGSQKITIVSTPVLQVVVAPVQPEPPYPDIPTGGGQQFQATVLGAVDPSQVEVSWLENGYSDGDGGIYGTITPGNPVTCVSTGDYAAPLSIPNPAQFPITAQSVYDSTKSASATITIVPVGITVQPVPTDPDVPQTSQQIFNADVTGTSDLNVYWSLSSKQCTGDACGTLNTPGPSTTTTYTAPAQGMPQVTLTAVSEANASAQGTATITVTCGGTPSISIFPSTATIAAGSASPLTFNPVINPCGNQSASVNWELGCISLWDGDPGENCNDTDFDGDGPGCTELNNGLGKICGDRSNVGPGSDPLSYYAPRKLFTNAFAPNVCEEKNNGSGDGMVPLTATVNLQGCPQQGCQATACITITPP
ncbi:MAG TPA: hypothetical protein VN950_21555 [Terriglobales bacterium]|nr:hypothetical protein [Terriglobales bacterium]